MFNYFIAMKDTHPFQVLTVLPEVKNYLKQGCSRELNNKLNRVKILDMS